MSRGAVADAGELEAMKEKTNLGGRVRTDFDALARGLRDEGE